MQAIGINPQSKRDLIDTLDIPRSTLDDIIRELEQKNLIKYQEGKWKTTVFGRCIFNIHDNYINNIDNMINTQPVIQELPFNTPVDRCFLLDSEVFPASSSVPDEVVQVLLESIEPASRIQYFTPVVMAGYLEEFYKYLMKNGHQVEVIFSYDVLSEVYDLYPNRVDNIFANKEITIYQGEMPVEFSLWIADEQQTGIMVYTDYGIRGAVKNNTNDAIMWAAELFNRIKYNAEPVYPADSK
ncbi:helix-turn-helix transcriptional regulator [Halocatena marina]|uniref:Helix-turn-helix transcriptional regulator n=1 Tax=Halocatena marina TaxID=2934937 RepID=A0ABD5YVK8_9EURY